MHRFSKKRLLVAALLGFFAMALIAGVFTVRYKKIVFYYEFPFRMVKDEYKTFSEELYSDYSDYINKMLVAQDSRSAKCIRFVIRSSSILDMEVRQAMLTDILTFKSTVPYTASFPGNWEVFFCCNEKLYDAYVTPYTKSTNNGVINITDDWFKVPERYIETISYNSIKLMLKRTYQQMYYLGGTFNSWENGKSIIRDTRIDYSEQIPSIPEK